MPQRAFGAELFFEHGIRSLKRFFPTVGLANQLAEHLFDSSFSKQNDHLVACMSGTTWWGLVPIKHQRTYHAPSA